MSQVFSSDLTLAFFSGFVISIFALIIQFLSYRSSSRQLAQASAVKAVEIMEEMRPERHLLYSVRESKKPYDQWTAREKEAANKATRYFDILGVFDSSGFIDRRFVDRFYAIPANEIWDICEHYVESERKTRGSQHLWEFQQFADRVKYVKGNHPALAGKKSWPRYPRRRYFHL